MLPSPFSAFDIDSLELDFEFDEEEPGPKRSWKFGVSIGRSGIGLSGGTPLFDIDK